MYSATYKQKKVIKLAPDAFVEIDGFQNIEICEDCHGEIKLSDYITNITTNLSTAGTVGTASFTISMPRHGHNGNYMVRGGRVYGISLMKEVTIYIKGRFPDNAGEYSYYKSFWGVITSIDERYIAGNQEITINCESMMKWLQLMKTNEHPSIQVFSNKSSAYSLATNLYTGKSYGNYNSYEIIYEMMSVTYKNVVVTDNLENEKVKNKDVPVITRRDSDIIKAWSQKFERYKKNLIMFGVRQEDIKIGFEKGDSTPGQNFSLLAAGNAVIPFQISYNYSQLLNFRPFLKPDERKDMDYIKNTYKSNLTIIEEVKLFSGFEFYLDTTGHFVFKPPFWNLDVRGNKVYVLDDEEILSWDWNESDAEVVTRVEVTGSLLIQSQLDSRLTPKGVYTNYALASQFGMKVQSVTMRFFTKSDMCYFHAISELDRFNANRFRGSVTIIGRPELRLGIPVYIISRDCFAYIENVSHNFSFGGPFTTTLSLSAVRRKYLGDETSNLVAKKDNLYATSGEFYLVLDSKPLLDEASFKSQVTAEEKKAQLDSTENTTTKITKFLEDVSTQLKGEKFENDNGGTYMTNRAGTYTVYHSSSSTVQAILSKFKKAKDSEDRSGYLDLLKEAIPLSDPFGYELIGIYENGKSLLLDKNNVLYPSGLSFVRTENLIPKGDTSSTSNKGAQFTDAIEPGDDFLVYKAYSLSDIAPSTGKDIKNCKCHDPGLDLITTRNTTGSNKKTFNQATNLQK